MSIKAKSKKITSPVDSITPTADYIAYFAALHPTTIAVVDENLKVTYEKFNEDIEKFIEAARQFKLKAGQIAAIEWTNLYEHWLWLLAFEALGVTTITYTANEVKVYWGDFDKIDLVICPKKHIHPNARKTHFITKAYFDKINASTPNITIPRKKLSPDMVVRIHCSSGTTGNVKRMGRTAKVHDVRIGQFQQAEGYNQSSQLLFHNGFSVQATYGRATACIRMGGACVISSSNIFPAIAQNEISHICLLPNTLETALLDIPKSYKRPKYLSVLTFGASLSPKLRAQIYNNFATCIIESYGANEVGFISTKSLDGMDIILPNVHVEVIDDDNEASFGKLGIVRIKGTSVIEGYLDDAGATARMFKKGWFYPGDIGIMEDRHSLKLLGRADDLINIGGIKINPTDYEDIINKLTNLKDLCVSSGLNDNGKNQIWIAATLPPPMTLKDLKDIVDPRLPKIMGTINYINITEMPRTATGKLQRKKVKERIANVKRPAKELIKPPCSKLKH